MSVMPSPDKYEPSKITGSYVVGGNLHMNLHAVLYSTADKNMVYFVKHVLLYLFCS